MVSILRPGIPRNRTISGDIIKPNYILSNRFIYYQTELFLHSIQFSLWHRTHYKEPGSMGATVLAGRSVVS